MTDQVRNFWDERGRENAAFYVDTSLDYDAPDMGRFFETGRSVVRDALCDAPVQPSQRRVAVEIGSGLGRICKALRQHFDHVIGIDIAESMVVRARQVVPDDGIEFRLGDGQSLAGIPDGSVDLVTTFTVFQHQPTTHAIVSYVFEAGRVLAPGGVLAAQWNNIPQAKYRVMKWRWRIAWRLRKIPLLGPRFGLHDRDGHRIAPQFLGTTATKGLMVDAMQRAGLVVMGTKGEGTLFAWIWAQRPTM